MSTSAISLESVTMRRVTLRVVPLLFVCYLACYLDRVNVGFAALSMNQDLGFSAAVYGLGAGIFFLSYVALEVPSTLLLHRFGARLWIARIMITWGVLSGAMAYIQQIAAFTGLSREAVFYGLRFLLGAAEAGFIPGVIFYLSLWFPAAYRARVLGLFMAALPLSSVVGAPLSGALLSYGGIAGLNSWRAMFIIEAVPALVLAVVLLFFLTDVPDRARWLLAEQRDWLIQHLAREEAERGQRVTVSVWQTIQNPFVVALGLVYFGVVAMNYTLGFFLPSIIHDFGLTAMQTGFVAALPPVVGGIATVVWGRRSDKKSERRWHLVSALALATVCFAAAAVIQQPVLKMACFTVAAFGIYGCQPVFWTLPSALLSGPALAAGIALVNSFANLSGFFGPYVMGWVKTSTGSYTGGLLLVAGVAAIATGIAFSIGKQHFATSRPVARVPATD